ncbi:MAG TPA: tetratricopeptide repeat protein [Chryseosolibacter sp.]
MRVVFSAILTLCSGSLAVAQLHYAAAGPVVNNFLNSRSDKYEPISVTWNMQGKIQADLNDGINYLLEEQPLQAEASFTIVLEQDATLWQAFYYRAVARKLMRRYHEALADLRSASKLNNKLYEARIEEARCYLALSSFQQSESAANAAIQIDKLRPAAYYVLGCVKEAEKNLPAAIRNYQRCLEVDKAYHDARISLAILELLANKRESVALGEFATVLASDSLNRDALMMRSILVFDKNKEQSLRDLNRLIRVSPTYVIGSYLRGVLLTIMGEYDRAFIDFQKVIKSTTTDDNNFEGQQSWIDKKIDIQNVGAYTLTRVYGLSDDDAAKFKQAYCLIMTGAFDESIRRIDQTSNPNQEPLAIYLKAVASEHRGNHVRAFDLYNEAIYRDKTIADAYKKRGIYRQELKEWDRSIEDFTTVLKLMPDSYVMYKIRGISYYYNKELEKAVADFSAYLKRDSTDIQTISYRGVAYRDLNQRLPMYMDFANARVNDFNQKDMMHLVDSVLLKGDTALAVSALTSFVKHRPWFTEAYAKKLKIHARQNNWPAIEQGLPEALDHKDAEVRKEDLSYLLTLKGILADRSNTPDEALNAFKEAIKVDKANANAYVERGKMLVRTNKTSQAADDFRKAASLGSTEARKLLDALGVKD